MGLRRSRSIWHSMCPEPLLGVGAHLKNCVALAWERRAVVSPHIGTLESPRALAVFERTIEDLQRLYGVRVARVACDAHPGYASTRHAVRMGLPLTRDLASPRACRCARCRVAAERDWLGVHLGRRWTRRGRHAVGRRDAGRVARALVARRHLPSLPPARRRSGGARALAHCGLAVLGDRTRARWAATANRDCCGMPGRIT